jgi:hypothetical protein
MTHPMNSEEKKVWVEPKLEALEIDETLGGTQPGFTETVFDRFGKPFSPFGTIPDPAAP